MKLQLLFFCLLSSILLFSCGPEVKGNQRSFIQGTVKDFEGKPVTNTRITLKTSSLLLGEGSTGANGKFEFTSLQPEFGGLTLSVNEENSNSSFGNYTVIYNDAPFKESYSFPDIILPKKATLAFNIKKTSTENNTLDWSLQYTHANCNIHIDQETNQNIGNCYETVTIGRILNNAEPNFERELPAVLNSTALFTYQLNEEDPQTISIELTEDTNFYEFEY